MLLKHTHMQHVREREREREAVADSDVTLVNKEDVLLFLPFLFNSFPHIRTRIRIRLTE